ncbi:uncharacterized protein RJT20DRAFT_6935 [Scheffersomyces xylosifermentans]|uniref:uncharacterized protein n=1 Tax=Scheffersomyces xylosifermentans TaxID=1304137 RepID=UPI00315D63F4
MSEIAKLNKDDLYVYNLNEKVLKSLELLYFDSATFENVNYTTKSPSTPSNDLNSLTSENLAKIPPTSSPKPVIPQKDTISGVVTPSTTGSRDSSYYKSDLYKYNLKRSLNGLPPLTEEEFENLLESQSIESLSGSESESEEDDDDPKEDSSHDQRMDLLMKKLSLQKAETGDQEESSVSYLNTKSPFLLFRSSLLSSGNAFGIYKSLFSEDQLLNDPLEGLKSFSSLRNKSSALFMIGGGHFAGAIISHMPKNTRGNAKNAKESIQEQAVNIVVSKTFHRYTTRRKQGGSQSASDNARGKANSAGSSIRRYNEQALIKEVRELLQEWNSYLKGCTSIFIRANGASNRKILVGYEGCVITNEDPRLRSFPFTTKRATTSELKRAWVELSYLTVTELPKINAKAKKAEERLRSPTPGSKEAETEKKSPEQIENEKHSQELIGLLKKQRAPKVISYIKQNKIAVNDFKLTPDSKFINFPTLLHYASANNLHHMVQVLLVSLQADPSIKNSFGKTPVEITSDTNTKRAFQIARDKLGEEVWDWTSSKVGVAKSKESFDIEDEEEAKRVKSEKQKLIKEELDKKTELELKKPKFSSSGALGVGIGPNIVNDLNGLSQDQKNRILREQRARAAEARLKRLSGN